MEPYCCRCNWIFAAIQSNFSRTIPMHTLGSLLIWWLLSLMSHWEYENTRRCGAGAREEGGGEGGWIGTNLNVIANRLIALVPSFLSHISMHANMAILRNQRILLICAQLSKLSMVYMYTHTYIPICVCVCAALYAVSIRRTISHQSLNGLTH